MIKSIIRPDNRWTRMDINIQKQIDLLMSTMRTRDKAKVADEAGITACGASLACGVPGES